MIARQRQRTNLQESELGGFLPARQADRKLNLHGIAQRVFAGAHQHFENRRQRERCRA